LPVGESWRALFMDKGLQVVLEQEIDDDSEIRILKIFEYLLGDDVDERRDDNSTIRI